MCQLIIIYLQNMSLLASQTDSPDNYVFVARLTSVKTLSTLLKALSFKEEAIFCASDRGLRVTVEHEKCVQASAYIQGELFQEYELQDEEVIFKINLGVLIECLNIFGGACSMVKIAYRGYGFPLKILMEESGIITDCSLKSLETEAILDFSYIDENPINKVIMTSKSLQEVFAELDSTSEVVEMHLSPDPPHLQVSTFGVGGDVKIKIPKDSDVVDVYQCSMVAVCRYKFSHLKSTTKALGASEKVSIRMDDRGLLCFQYMISAESQTCYIEYYVRFMWGPRS